MKIVAILGSPRRNGNSETLAREVLREAEEQGAQIAVHVLNEMNIKGCQGCELCKTKREDCALKDDLSPVLTSMYEADVLLVASPVYFGELTSQAKAFVDRCYSFAKPDFMNRPDVSRLPSGKKLIFIMSQGAPEEMHQEIYPRYEYYFNMMGFTERRLVRACGVGGKTEASQRGGFLDEARQAAASIFNEASN